MSNKAQITRIIELGVQQVSGNARDQKLAIAALAQENARARVSAGTVTNLTDNSSGTSGGYLSAVVTPTTVAQDGVALLAPKAAFDTQIGLIEDAHRELLAKANEFIALIAAGSPTVGDLTNGVAADNTILAMSAALTGSAAADVGVLAAPGVADINIARNNQAAICAAINWVRVAQGLAPISDMSGGFFDKTQDSYVTQDAIVGVWAGEWAGMGATTAAAGADSLTEASAEAALTALINNIATMAAALTEANAPAIGPFVVATNNARTRFSNGDITP